MQGSQEPVGAEPSASARVRIRRGRSYCYSPEWAKREGIEVLFDRNSGDFWLLSAAAMALIRSIADRGPDFLETGALAPPDDGGPPAVDATLELMRELADEDILEFE